MKSFIIFLLILYLIFIVVQNENSPISKTTCIIQKKKKIK